MNRFRTSPRASLATVLPPRWGACARPLRGWVMVAACSAGLAPATGGAAPELSGTPVLASTSDASTSDASSIDYVIDPGRTELVVQVFKEGIAARLAHDHVIRASQVGGTLRYDPARPAEAALEVVVQAKSLVVDEVVLRQKYGLPGALGEGDIATITENMRAPDQLWVERYPTIRFTSKRFVKQADGTYAVPGVFELRGVKKPVTVQAIIEPAGADGLRGTATVALRQSDFGYAPYRAMLGAIANRDEVLLHIDLVAKPVEGR